MNRRPAEREYCVEHAALSDVGLCRSNNQDSLIVSPADSVQGRPPPPAGGGRRHGAHGEVASQMAVEVVLVYRNQANGKFAAPARRSPRPTAKRRQGRSIGRAPRHGNDGRALLLRLRKIIAHVGDSRVPAARQRPGAIDLDHSLGGKSAMRKM